MLVVGSLLLACLLSPSTYALLLETGTDRVTLGQTPDVQLNCTLGDGDVQTQTIMIIERLRITKRDASGSRITFAEVRSPANKISTIGHTVTVTGSISDPMSAFIKVSWPMATGSTLGVYGCELSGYDKFDNFVSVRAAPRSIEENVMTSDDVVNIVQSITIGYQKKQAELERKIVNLETVTAEQDKEIVILKTVTVELEKEIVNLKTFVTDELNKTRQDETKCSCQDVTTPPNEPARSAEWPTGSYFLLEPRTGCPRPASHSPLSSSGNGSHFTTVSPDKAILVVGEMAIGMKLTIHDDNGSVRKMEEVCSMESLETLPTATRPWPKGSYCIGRHLRDACPGEFEEGGSGLRYAITDSAVPAKTFPFWYMTYCCRSDGNAQAPIRLPTRDPFHLFRYNGSCQQVEGMAVTSHFMTLTAAPGFDTDRYSSIQFEVGTYPDLGPNCTVTACHYEM